MRERVGQILKGVCVVLAAVLLYQLVQVARRVNPLSHVKIPDLPRLASDTNIIAGAPSSGPARSSTNATARGSETNASGTNGVATKTKKGSGTNGVAGDVTSGAVTNGVDPANTEVSHPTGAREKVIQRTNESAALKNETASGEKLIAATASSVSTNAPADTNSDNVAGMEIKPPANASPTEPSFLNETNPVAKSSTNNPPARPGTNVVEAAVADSDRSLTNAPVRSGPEAGVAKSHSTNLAGMAVVDGTNVVSSRTNSPKRAKSKSTNSPASPAMAMEGMNPSQMRGGGGKPAELAPEIKARVDRIYESELFGMVMRPQPMALLGIAGNSAFLRAPSGQTGLVKEGDSLGEIKLVRIGINRVLVEQDGMKTELKIFDGYGGESLMPKDKETSK